MLLIEDELQKTSEKAKGINNETLIKRDLVFPSYSLPEGLYTFLFKLTVKDEKNSSMQYNPNINTVFINTKVTCRTKYMLTVVYMFSVM